MRCWAKAKTAEREREREREKDFLDWSTFPAETLLWEDDGVPDPVLEVSLGLLVDDLLDEGDDMLLPHHLFLEI